MRSATAEKFPPHTPFLNTTQQDEVSVGCTHRQHCRGQCIMHNGYGSDGFRALRAALGNLRIHYHFDERII